MTDSKNLIFIFIGSLLLLLTLTSYTPSTPFSIHITNIKKIEGVIEIGIFNHKDDFPIVGNQVQLFREPVTKDHLIKNVLNLPNGEYAIAIYHDINSDGECNKNFIGYPKEPFAFSNNVRPFLSAPSFESAKFTIPMDEELHIRLNK